MEHPDPGEAHRHAHDDGHGHEDGQDHDHGHDHGHGVLGRLRSALTHSHDTGEQVAAALSASDDGIRALKVSLFGLAVTAALQGVVVAVSGSVALLADMIHNFSDALTAVPLGIAFWVGRRPPDKSHTYGYGRAEDLAGITVVGVIAASTAVAAWVAVDRLRTQQTVHALGWVALAGFIGFVGNELVAVYRIRTGRRIGSAALVADGLHARTDGLASIAVVIGAAGVALGWKSADPIVALLITVVVLAVLRAAARDIYRRLMDSVDPKLVDEVRGVLSSVPGVERVDVVRIRWIGHELHAEAEIVSDSELTISAGHAIAEEARHRLLHEVPRLTEAVIHTSPCSHDGTDPHAATAHHFRPAAQ